MNSHDQDPFGPVLQTMEKVAPDAPLLGTSTEPQRRNPAWVVAGAFALVILVGAVGLIMKTTVASTDGSDSIGGQGLVSGWVVAAYLARPVEVAVEDISRAVGPNVEIVGVITLSSEQNRQQTMVEFANDENLITILEENPDLLPPAIRVMVLTEEDGLSVADSLSRLKGIEEVVGPYFGTLLDSGYTATPDEDSDNSNESSVTTTIPGSEVDRRVLAAMDIVMASVTANKGDDLIQAAYSGLNPLFDATTLGMEVPFDPIRPDDIDFVTERLWATSVPEGEVYPIVSWTPVYIGYFDGYNVGVRVIRERDALGVATDYVCTNIFDAEGGTESCNDFLDDDASEYTWTQYVGDGNEIEPRVSLLLLSNLATDVSVVTMDTPDESAIWQRPVGGVVIFDTQVLAGSAAQVTMYDVNGKQISSAVISPPSKDD